MSSNLLCSREESSANFLDLTFIRGTAGKRLAGATPGFGPAVARGLKRE
jgi:hypothetical protein